MKITGMSVDVRFDGIDLATGQVSGETDSMANTGIRINDGAEIAPRDEPYEFAIANGDKVKIIVRSGALSGTVHGLPHGVTLRNASWEGSYGGLTGGLCALATWEARPTWHEPCIDSSAWPELLSWDEYEAAHNAAALVRRLSPDDKRRMMISFLAWLKGWRIFFAPPVAEESTSDLATMDQYLTLERVAALDEEDDDADPYAGYE